MSEHKEQVALFETNCPNCKSNDVYVLVRNPNVITSGSHGCRVCGHQWSEYLRSLPATPTIDSITWPDRGQSGKPVLFVRILEEELDLDYEQIVGVIKALEDTCPSCRDTDTSCRCNNDEIEDEKH
ncbi:hypothetical protein LCGC14_2770570 [marine sediment metagenome]|uniref:Uncharacterized protein n=1 Tax=marine sediment metagenome TaxID=412755 RepID=A0A0F9B504_9ZZZZ